LLLILLLLGGAVAALGLSFTTLRWRGFAVGSGVVLLTAAALAIAARRGLIPGSRPRPWKGGA
jgi:hypothetical protein